MRSSCSVSSSLSSKVRGCSKESLSLHTALVSDLGAAQSKTAEQEAAQLMRIRNLEERLAAREADRLALEVSIFVVYDWLICCPGSL